MTAASVPGVTTVSPNAMLVGCVGINSSNTAVTRTWTLSAAREFAGWLVALRPA